MTIAEAIERIDDLKPNNYTQHDKIVWLNQVDLLIKREIIDTHEDGEDIEFSGYDDETNIETPLLVGDPYSTLYISWLETKIDYSNGEYAKYNNSATVFNTDYQNYERWYNRHHMPKGTQIKFF